MDISKVLDPVTRFGGRLLFKANVHSPEILVGVGVVSVVGAGVLLVRGALRAQPEITETIDFIKEVQDDEMIVGDDVERFQRENKEALKQSYKALALTIGKNYVPAITLGAVGITCILGAHHILRQRNIAIAAAYKALEFSFSEYRKRVAAEFGEEKELKVYRAQSYEKVADPDTGKKEMKLVQHAGGYSPYAVLFSEETSALFQKNRPDWNVMTLDHCLYEMNRILKSRGHVTLNDVFDWLQMERTQAGMVVGWVYESEHGDSYVDFGLTNKDNEAAMRFISGVEENVWIDFNVDGNIFDEVGKPSRKNPRKLLKS